jgi:hypothetical protein
MRLTGWEQDGTWVFELELSAADLGGAAGPSGDLDLMADCADSGSVADQLLALEAIARRVENRALADRPGPVPAPSLDTADAASAGAAQPESGAGDDARGDGVPADQARKRRFRRPRRPPAE